LSYSVGQVAGFVGVTIRTLHHYDEIGLLSPRGRSAAGYRIYEEADLERLHQILFYRELGFTLEEIATIVDDPRTDAVGHLRRQHGLLTERIKRLQAMVAAIDHEMEAMTMGTQLRPEERFDVFGDFRSEDYAEEAKQRWDDTEAYRQSQRRVATYTKEDWLCGSRPRRSRCEPTSPRPSRQAWHRIARRQWLLPRRTASTSAGGSTSAAMRSTGV
jgi:MerR family transcriptional regulator, thiopeptide resistance regulator